jgi:hypothetical protein
MQPDSPQQPDFEPSISWHPAFVEAIRLELEQYGDALEIIPEFQLTAEPLRIDVVVVKKRTDIAIDKNIARIFKRDNLLEYKSPDDFLSVQDFYKVYGYACLYASLEKTPITEITLSFIESRYPRKLLTHLREARGYSVEEKSPGIYTVIGDILPIQVIDSRRLSEDENLWLKNLSGELDITSGRRVVAEIERQGKAARLGAYLYAITWANAAIMQEVTNMSSKAAAFEQALADAGWVAKWKVEGKAEGEIIGEVRGKLEVAKNLLDNGFSVEQTAQYAKIDIEKVRALWQ